MTLLQACGRVSCLPQAAIAKDEDAWGGRRYHLKSMLFEHWAATTKMKTEAHLPENFKSQQTNTPCWKHGQCVCTDSDRVDLYHLHSKFIKLFKPFITLAKKSGSSASKEARKPATRQLLDKSLLVLRLHLPPEVVSALKAPSHAGMHQAWRDAQVKVLAEARNKPPHEEVWLHICYANLQTFMFSMLQLVKDDTVSEDSLGNAVIRLKVPPQVCVYTALQAFDKFLQLRLPWNASWYAIDSTSKPVDTDFLVPETVDVRALPEEQIPLLRLWHGSDIESVQRDLAHREANSKRKRASKHSATPGTKSKASRQGPAAEPSGPSDDGLMAAFSDLENPDHEDGMVASRAPDLSGEPGGF